MQVQSQSTALLHVPTIPPGPYDLVHLQLLTVLSEVLQVAASEPNRLLIGSLRGDQTSLTCVGPVLWKCSCFWMCWAVGRRKSGEL